MRRTILDPLPYIPYTVEDRLIKPNRLPFGKWYRGYIKKETTFKDRGYIFFSTIEEDFRLLNKPFVMTVKKSSTC